MPNERSRWVKVGGRKSAAGRKIFGFLELISKIQFQGILWGSGGDFFCVLNPTEAHRSLSASTVLAEAGLGDPQQLSVCRHAAKLLVLF